MGALLSLFERIARMINVRLRLIVAFTLVLAGVTGLMGIYATYNMGQKIMETPKQKIATDLALGKEIIDLYYPGDWQIKGGKLYKGDTLIEGNHAIVDRIGELTGDTISICKNDTRVATTIIQNGERMVNTKVADEVAEIVLKRGESYHGKAQVVGVWNEAGYEPIRDKNGQIIGIWSVGVPSTTYDAMVNRFRWNMIGYSAIGISFGFIAAVLIAYTVHAPLRRIGQALNIVSEGDLTQTIPVDGNDELGALAERVNMVIEKMSELIAQTKELATNVAEASDQLLQRSEISAGLMEEMAVQAEEMNSNTDLQAELTTKSKNAITDMTNAIQQLAENAQEVSTSANSATNMARDGGQQIEKAIKQINIISDTVNSTAEIIRELGNKSQEIGQIVDLITNIASQTNLLALNAAIEAARAGDQGRGFAVVAEEVRKLAEESEEATKRIALLIKQIQEESNKAVQAMEAGTKEVANGTEVVATAGEAFEHIIKAVERVNEQIQEISAASQEMAASAEAAIDSIEKTTVAAENNAQLAKTISEMAEEQAAGTEEINASVDSLNNIVVSLEKAISYFKVK